MASAILTMGCTSIASALITSAMSRILEVDDIGSFRVFYTSSAPAEIRLEGFVWHSAIGIYDIETVLNGNIMNIVLRGALVTKYNLERFKGPMDYKFTVPDAVDIVTFGEKNVVIWDRREANSGVRVKKIEGEPDFMPLEKKYKTETPEDTESKTPERASETPASSCRRATRSRSPRHEP